MVEFALYENITDTELQKIFEEIQHTDQRLDYIKRYYTERKEEYEIRDFSSSDNKINGKIEVFKKRDIKNHEIDEALFFVNKGYDVTLKTILKEIEKKKLKGDFTGTFNELLFVKNGTIDRIKNMAGLAEADTCHNQNIPWSNTIVNQKQEE